ncbi:hypothetical protein [Dyadobacter fermentans]|nr:hypothetical protein [Dyadobacter fermentans]
MKSWATQTLVFVMLAVMLVKTMVVPVIYLDYELRKDYIISTLCENRNRPQLNCDGKCYLAKRIAEAAKQEQRQAESDFMTKMLSAQAPVTNDFLTHFITTPRTVELLPAVTFNYASPFNGRNFVLDIFHPPLC